MTDTVEEYPAHLGFIYAADLACCKRFSSVAVQSWSIAAIGAEAGQIRKQIELLACLREEDCGLLGVGRVDR